MSTLPSLSERALLVTLSISGWMARRLDKHETAALAAKHGTNERVARVNKSLMPECQELEALHAFTREVRRNFEWATLPWLSDGSRILPSANYMNFTQDVQGWLTKWERLKREFVGAYPLLKERSRHALNGLYREDDYPHPDKVGDKFSARVRFFPIPNAKDFRVELLDADLERMAKDLEAASAEALKGAMAENWKRLHEVVSRAAERLSDPTAVFRDSLVENAKDCCDLLRRMNLTGDPHLEEARQTVERTLARTHPTTLRESVSIREDVAAQMRATMAKMSAFMGAA